MAVPAPHIHHAIVHVTQKPIAASFKGRASINGSTLTISSLTGRIRNDRFTGFGSGTIGGNVFQAGNVTLSNRHGTVQLMLETGQFVKIGKSTRQVIPIVVMAASGKYAPFANHTGVILKWNIPATPNAPARFAGLIQA
jgi:hypothetical protein